MTTLDKWIPTIVKVYNPFFFLISLFGIILLFLGITPSGFGIPLIFWIFAFIGHVVQYSFTKKIGVLSLCACVLCATWMVGSLFHRITENAAFDATKIVTGIAFLGFMVISIFYVKIANGLKPPVSREYTWEDFKYDYAERKQEWDDKLESTKMTLTSVKEKTVGIAEWVKQRLPRKEEKAPILYLPLPREESIQSDCDSESTPEEQSSDVEIQGKFRIVNSTVDETPASDNEVDVTPDVQAESESPDGPDEDMESVISDNVLVEEEFQTSNDSDDYLHTSMTNEEPIPKEESKHSFQWDKPKEEKKEKDDFWKFS